MALATIPSHAGAEQAPVRLDRYLDRLARYREIVVVPAAAGSMLVVDRLADRGLDARLVAHLAPDEPASNALLVCDEYLSRPDARWCRPINRTDRLRCPNEPPVARACEREILEPGGDRYRLERVPSHPRAGVELRWVRWSADGVREIVSLRAVIAAIEDYEPPRSRSVRAIQDVRSDREACSVATLEAEVRRLDSSPIVLNRGLREAVLEAVHQGLSLSTIATRCGRVKRDSRGNVSGETSWLARRLGLLPEGGGRRITPWVHSDTLGLIARRGLGLSPREVELG